MKTERAIELLNRISDSQFDGEYGDERREALSMAVRALEGDGDTISRQQAIDAVVSAMIDGADAELVEGVMELLPSAQPQWIPCSERLPSEGDTVLLSENYAYSIGRLIKTTTGEYEWSVNGWYTNIDDWSTWMPLPKPYGGESE